MFNYQHDHPEIREAVAKLCADFDGKYWQSCDAERAYPTAFVKALTEAGYLSALIPEEYGGLSLPISAGAAILEEIHHSGGMALTHRRQSFCPESLMAACGFRPLVSPSRQVELTQAHCAQWRGVTVTNMLLMAKRYGHRELNIRTFCCFWRGPRQLRNVQRRQMDCQYFSSICARYAASRSASRRSAQ
jgi:hypothetical protein